MKRVISFVLVNILTLSTVFAATEADIKNQLDKAASNIKATETIGLHFPLENLGGLL